MDDQRKRWLLIGALVALALAAGIFGLARPAAPGDLPSRVGQADCQRDPANLPPPPAAPDGLPVNYLHTCGSQILDAHGRVIRIAGVNWSGMETSGYAPGGLGNRNWQDVLDQIAGLGYNTVRIPFSSEAIDSGQPIAGVNFDLNPDLQGLTGLQMLDRLVHGARERGLKVILDRHQPTSANRTELWYDQTVPQSKWIADWRMLAARYRGNDTVIGVDLANEPHGPATWGTGDPATDWRLAAERAGNAALAENPYLLIFMEGIETVGNDRFWWGGNLSGARTAPVRLNVPNRLVYSPHDYGPAISGQSWFNDPRFPANLPAVWDQHWGYLHHEGIAPVVVGEFGGWSFGNDADGLWQKALLAYLTAHQIGAIVWELNPTWDTGGILQGDWLSVDPVKQAAYRVILAPPIAVGPSGVFGRSQDEPTVLLRMETGGQPGEVAFSFRIFNDGPDPLDLGQLEVRYWLRAGPLDPRQTRPQADAGALPGATLRADLVPTQRGGQTAYLRIRFGPGSGQIARYRQSGKVTVRFVKPNATSDPPSADYSYLPTPLLPERIQAWDRVTLYRNGKLVWGKEP